MTKWTVITLALTTGCGAPAERKATAEAAASAYIRDLFPPDVKPVIRCETPGSMQPEPVMCLIWRGDELPPIRLYCRDDCGLASTGR